MQLLELLGVMRAAFHSAFHLTHLCCVSGGRRLLQTTGTSGTKCDYKSEQQSEKSQVSFIGPVNR